VWLAVIIGILVQAALLAWMYRSGGWKKVMVVGCENGTRERGIP
jgi:hypothetical protein